MCGIAGVYNLDGKAVDEHILEDMISLIAHRGPDYNDIYTYKNIGIAHARLKIIDLTSFGNQPMTNETGTVYITYNGEIYNYMELRKELQKKGYRFMSRTDTEVVIYAYEEYGEEFLEKLRGMFAFAIYDARQDRILLVRDRLGIKPLYYYYKGNSFIFSSEIKAILRHPAVSAEVNKTSIYEYLNKRYVVAPDTMFKDIYKVEPGNYLIVDSEGIKIKNYWNTEFSDYNADEEFYVEKLRNLLAESVRMRMISDVPLGVFLSGGLDSSSITAMASSFSHKPLKTFTARFEGGELFDEGKYAKAISRYFNTEHHELLVKQPTIDILNKIIWHLEEPIADTAVIPTYLISELTKKFVTVILTGEGSDEMNAGYRKYLLGSYVQRYRSLPEIIKRVIENNILRVAYPPKLRKLIDYSKVTNLDYIKKTEFSFLSGSGIVLEDGLLNMINRSQKNELWTKTFRNHNPSNLLNYIFQNDIRGWLADDLLLKVDKMTMAHSLEARVPFLDHKIVEFTHTIPPLLKLKNLKTKYLLRRAMEGLLPKTILNRKQHGFNVPFVNWLKGDTKGYIKYILTSDIVRKRGYFKWQSVKGMLDTQFSGKKDYSFSIFMLLMLELWHREFID